MASPVQLKSLKLFCDVVACRSFSQAADQNGISQSGASQMVNHLEERLGVKLLDRSRRPFVLTPAGQRYYEGCRKVVETYFALEESIRTRPEEIAGTVTVASIYSVGLSYMHRFVEAFLADYPDASVRLRCEHPKDVYELVEKDQVELGLVSYPRSSRSIQAEPWREEPMVLVCAPRHALAGKPEVSLAELDGLAMVGFDRDLQIRREIDRALAAAKADVRVALEFDNIEAIKRAIEINGVVGLLPEPSVSREVRAGSLSAVPLAGGPVTRPLGLIRRRGRQLGKTATRFIHFLKEKADALSVDTAENTLSAV